MKKIYLHIALLGIGFLLSGCQWISRQHQAGVVAELDGNFLYQTDIDPLVIGLNSEDSARVADNYIRQWATDILVYDEAKDRADKKLEALVEDYRRSLYVYAYEQKLVAQRMPKRVSPDIIADFYTNHQSDFVLRESIVHGLLLVVPNDAPKMDELRKAMRTLDEDALEKIEKYAYQYASGYEYFPEQWKTANQLLLSMPFTQNDLQSQLRQKNQIELQDSISTYILCVTEKYLAGENMPIDYATPEIEKLILTQRQVEFLNSQREELYNSALRYKRIRIYNEQ